jgi:hypothetical protein
MSYIKDRPVYRANRYNPYSSNCSSSCNYYNILCDNGNNNDPESDIAVVAGVAPDLEPVELEYIAELSDLEDNSSN